MAKYKILNKYGVCIRGGLGLGADNDDYGCMGKINVETTSSINDAHKYMAHLNKNI